MYVEAFRLALWPSTLLKSFMLCNLVCTAAIIATRYHQQEGTKELMIAEAIVVFSINVTLLLVAVFKGLCFSTAEEQLWEEREREREQMGREFDGNNPLMGYDKDEFPASQYRHSRSSSATQSSQTHYAPWPFSCFSISTDGAAAPALGTSKSQTGGGGASETAGGGCCSCICRALCCCCVSGGNKGAHGGVYTHVPSTDQSRGASGERQHSVGGEHLPVVSSALDKHISVDGMRNSSSSRSGAEERLLSGERGEGRGSSSSSGGIFSRLKNAVTGGSVSPSPSTDRAFSGEEDYSTGAPYNFNSSSMLNTQEGSESSSSGHTSRALQHVMEGHRAKIASTTPLLQVLVLSYSIIYHPSLSTIYYY